MKSQASFRGQPLLVLLVLLGGWVGLRMVMWQPPFAYEANASTASPAPRSDPVQGKISEPRTADALLPLARLLRRKPGQQTSAGPGRLAPKVAAGTKVMNIEASSGAARLSDPGTQFEPGRLAVPAASTVQPPVHTMADGAVSRWSSDGWLLLRCDTTTPVTSGRGSYGRSQMGAVIRYRLFGDDPFRSTAYLRASHALAGAHESEVAAGFAARPFPRVPVSTAAEIRVTEVGGEAHERTAAYAVTELPPFELPIGFTGEAYAQAGYVWGDFSTGFVDGQLRAERPLARIGDAQLSVGGGTWGGAQKGAARLDVGPGATLKLKLGGAGRKPVNARLSVDWRFRVLGNAEPASGPALTLSAGF